MKSSEEASPQNFTKEMQTSYLSGASRYRLMRLSQVQKTRKFEQDDEERSLSPR